MNEETRPTVLETLLDQIYRNRDRLTGAEIREQAARLPLPATLRARIEQLPDGGYDREEADAALHPRRLIEATWRNEERLPLGSLARAMAVYSAEGQADDPTGHDAGAEQAFGHEPLPPETAAEPDPESVPGRRLRLPPDGRLGPH